MLSTSDCEADVLSTSDWLADVLSTSDWEALVESTSDWLADVLSTSDCEADVESTSDWLALVESATDCDNETASLFWFDKLIEVDLINSSFSDKLVELLLLVSVLSLFEFTFETLSSTLLLLADTDSLNNLLKLWDTLFNSLLFSLSYCVSLLLNLIVEKYGVPLTVFSFKWSWSYKFGTSTKGGCPKSLPSLFWSFCIVNFRVLFSFWTLIDPSVLTVTLLLSISL